MKTETTQKLEHEIWKATSKIGTFACFEVTIGWFGKERVDYMTYDTKGIWRCYEIKASKSDFYSKAKKTFIGHYNYYVLTKELFEQVKDDIPSHIGVYVNGTCVKHPRKQELMVDKEILYDSFIRSLYREAEKLYKSGQPSIIERKNRRIKQLERKLLRTEKEINDLEKTLYKKFGKNWHEVIETEE